jgi:peptidoglycan/LPS O-acetylase OafA/YrhL
VDTLPALTHRRDIDGLRGIAVLAVLVFHAFPTALGAGFVGVDVFFVISGYLITRIILREQAGGVFSLMRFFQRRIHRIFPALLLVLTACLALGWWGLMPPEFKQLGAQVAAGGAFVANILFWQQAGYFDAAAQLKPLLHLWSLGIEEQYYLLWPLFLLLWRGRPRGLLASSLALALLSLAFNSLLLASWPEATFYLLHSRFWELLAGGLLAMSPALRTTPPATLSSTLLRNLGAITGLLLIGLAMALFGQPAPYPGWRALLPVGGTALVIGAGASCRVNRVLLSNRPLVAIGLISYPLYLWHWPVLAFARVLLPQATSPAWLATLLLVSGLLAWATYRWLELPLREARARGHGRTLAMALAMLMAGVAACGYAIFLQGGLPGRYPQAVRHLVDFHYDHEAAYRSRECFIDRIEDLDRALHFSPACVDAPGPATGQPLLLLWGDSTAAHLYPGLRAQQAAAHFRLAQFTEASCPPVMGYKPNALCAQVNAATAKRIASIAPDVAILSGLGWTPGDKDEIAQTVRFLYSSGVRKVVIVGSPPRWVDAPPRLMYQAMLADPQRRVPEFLATGLQGSNTELDAAWAALAASVGADYVSAYKALCDARGCVVRVGDNPQDIVGWDTFHLTTTGSELLLSRIMPSLLPRAATPP